MQCEVWYANHAKYGELILALRPVNHFERGIVYCVAMIEERLRHRMNQRIEAELQIGPCGLIHPAYYQEASICVRPPERVRKLVSLDKEHLTPLVDEQICAWIISEWNRQVGYASI